MWEGWHIKKYDITFQHNHNEISHNLTGKEYPAKSMGLNFLTKLVIYYLIILSVFIFYGPELQFAISVENRSIYSFRQYIWKKLS